MTNVFKDAQLEHLGTKMRIKETPVSSERVKLYFGILEWYKQAYSPAGKGTKYVCTCLFEGSLVLNCFPWPNAN